MKIIVRGRKQAKEETKNKVTCDRLRTKEGKLKYCARLNNKVREAKRENGDKVEAV